VSAFRAQPASAALYFPLMQGWRELATERLYPPQNT